MSKQKQKQATEQQLRLMKFDCESRIKLLEVAASMSKGMDELKENTATLAQYAFTGLFDQPEE